VLSSIWRRTAGFISSAAVKTIISWVYGNAAQAQVERYENRQKVIKDHPLAIILKRANNPVRRIL
jgi:hypothetical protein